MYLLWHVETRHSTDPSMLGSTWQRHPVVNEDTARIQYAALLRAGVHVRLMRLVSVDSLQEKIEASHTPL